jgi:hypothetical protein
MLSKFDIPCQKSGGHRAKPANQVVLTLAAASSQPQQLPHVLQPEQRSSGFHEAGKPRWQLRPLRPTIRALAGHRQH